MKTTILTFLCAVALILSAAGQTPTPPSASPSPQVTATPSPTATPMTTPLVTASPMIASPTVGPAASATAAAEDEDDIGRAVAWKLRKKHHIGITMGGHKDIDSDIPDAALMAIPIVGIIFSTLFGAPVLVVAAIMFFSYLKARSLHRTVRSMVDKGQEVPAALFATPPVIRARNDLRRGVVLLMVGFGMMVFFGAVNNWEDGVWSLGIIPFLIGAGYLLVWKLEGRRDKVPPLP